MFVMFESLLSSLPRVTKHLYWIKVKLSSRTLLETLNKRERLLRDHQSFFSTNLWCFFIPYRGEKFMFGFRETFD